MRPALRFLLVLAGVICLCLPALHAFTLGKMPQSADGLIQLQRTVALEHALRVDHPLWPRFASGLVYGYGAPLFNYFPPLSYMPASLLQILGAGALSSLLLMMGAYTVTAGVGMFLLGRLWTRSTLGGWVGATAYVYAPYLLFDSLTRGASAELAALAVLPFALYGFTRLALFGRRRDYLAALLAFSVFIPLHTLVTLHGTAMLMLYCLFLIWRADDRRAVFLRLSLAGGLALLLTAFYWLPALLESDAIKLKLIAEQLGHIDPTRHLRSLRDILALPHTADPTLQNQAVPISLGWPQLLLSGCRRAAKFTPAASPLSRAPGAVVVCSSDTYSYEHACIGRPVGECSPDRLHAVSLADAWVGEFTLGADDSGERFAAVIAHKCSAGTGRACRCRERADAGLRLALDIHSLCRCR